MQKIIIQLRQYLILYLTRKINNLHLEQVRPGWKTQSEIDIGNTIEYDLKSYQVKTTIVNFTNVQLEGLKTATAHRMVCWYSWHACDENNRILNNKRFCKWFRFERESKNISIKHLMRLVTRKLKAPKWKMIRF